MNKQPIGQTIVKRNNPSLDNIDTKNPELLTYEYLFSKEPVEDFVSRVTAEANKYNDVLNITYLDEDTAVIVWKEVSYIETVLKPEHNYTEIIDEIRVERYRDSKVTTGSEPYDVFQERVKRLASCYNLTSIIYPDQNTAIIRVFE